MERDGSCVVDGGNKIAHGNVRFISRSYDGSNSRGSALRLILAALPEWSGHEDTINLIRCTEGITNTLLKVVNCTPGATAREIEDNAVMLRAYGHGTDVIIDRDREAENHEVLMAHGLAPPLLARFINGMIYRYVPGTVTHPTDLGTPSISLAVARRLAQWHALVPCRNSPDSKRARRGTGGCSVDTAGGLDGPQSEDDNNEAKSGHDDVASKRGTLDPASKPSANMWTIMQRWISVLPVATKEQRRRHSVLAAELSRCLDEFGGRAGLGQDGLVFAHCDLLSGNIIVLPDSSADSGNRQSTVAFIDYEYAAPAPAAFDIANHFAEWAGLDCDYNALPTQNQRRAFVQEYAKTYFDLLGRSEGGKPIGDDLLETETAKLLAEVDAYRGIPGLYWAIWAAIQAVISEIEFDYASYSESRFSEYWAWRAQREGSLATKSPEMQLREKRWAQTD